MQIVVSQQEVERTKSTAPPFARRVLVVCLVGAAGLAVWKLSDVLVLAFGAALLALLLRGLAHEVSRRTRIPEAWSVVPVVLTLLGQSSLGAGCSARKSHRSSTGSQRTCRKASRSSAMNLDRAHGVLGFSGTRRTSILVAPARQLRATLPHCLVPSSGPWLTSPSCCLQRSISRCSPLGTLMTCYGWCRRLGGAARRKFSSFLELRSGAGSFGQAITMTVVGTLTAIGLALLGVTAPLALGLIAGMFAFVPYVGPILASVSGILMAAMQGPVLVGYVVALYVGIHFLEGNIINPLVQRFNCHRSFRCLPLLLSDFCGAHRRVVGRSARRRPARRGERALLRGDTRRTPGLAVDVGAPRSKFLVCCFDPAQRKSLPSDL